MNIHWNKSSIRRDVLIVFAVICLAFAAYCQKKKPKPKSFTLLEDNPAYVQKFVSKMMSKYPLGTEKPPRDYTGIENRPNLGYEPYWYNVPDLTWEQKCARCPDLFKRYTAVCALDSTGYVIVNVSMCNLMWQNCLAGIAYGRSTGVRNDFQGEYFVVADGWARVAFRQRYGALIQLSTTTDPDSNRYTIQIDGWGGTWSCFYRNDKPLKWFESWWTSLNPEIYIDYVMRWDDSGWFLITKKVYRNWTQAFHFNISDPDPFPIKYLAVSGYQGYKGDWIVKDLPTGLMVSSLDACAEGSVAQALPTSPTEVAYIMNNEPKVNKGYFSRYHEAGLDKENISFYTREEY